MLCARNQTPCVALLVPQLLLLCTALAAVPREPLINQAEYHVGTISRRGTWTLFGGAYSSQNRMLYLSGDDTDADFGGLLGIGFKTDNFAEGNLSYNIAGAALPRSCSYARLLAKTDAFKELARGLSIFEDTATAEDVVGYADDGQIKQFRLKPNGACVSKCGTVIAGFFSDCIVRAMTNGSTASSPQVNTARFTLYRPSTGDTFFTQPLASIARKNPTDLIYWAGTPVATTFDISQLTTVKFRTEARFGEPSQFAIAQDAVMYITDTTWNALRQIDLNTGLTSLVLGDGTRTAPACVYNCPTGVAYTTEMPSSVAVYNGVSTPRIFWGERSAFRIRVYDPATNLASYVLGTSGGWKDGAVATAQIDEPRSLATSDYALFIIEPQAVRYVYIRYPSTRSASMSLIPPRTATQTIPTPPPTTTTAAPPPTTTTTEAPTTTTQPPTTTTTAAPNTTGAASSTGAPAGTTTEAPLTFPPDPNVTTASPTAATAVSSEAPTTASMQAPSATAGPTRGPASVPTAIPTTVSAAPTTPPTTTTTPPPKACWPPARLEVRAGPAANVRGATASLSARVIETQQWSVMLSIPAESAAPADPNATQAVTAAPAPVTSGPQTALFGQTVRGGTFSVASRGAGGLGTGFQATYGSGTVGTWAVIDARTVVIAFAASSAYAITESERIRVEVPSSALVCVWDDGVALTPLAGSMSEFSITTYVDTALIDASITAGQVSVGAAAALNPGAATGAQVLAGLQFMSCGSPAQRKLGSAAWMLAPLYREGDRIEWMAVSNGLILVSVSFAHVLLLFLLTRSDSVVAKLAGADAADVVKQEDVALWEIIAAKLHFPSALLTLGQLALQGTVLGALAALAHDREARTVIGASFGLSVVAVYLASWVYIHYFHSHRIAFGPNAQRDRVPPQLRIVLPYTAWTPETVRRMFALELSQFREVKSGRSSFPQLLLRMHHLLGLTLTSSLMSYSAEPEECVPQAGFIASVFFLIAVGILGTKPYRRGFYNYTYAGQYAANGLLFAGVASLLSDPLGPGQGVMAAGVMLQLLCSLLAMIYTALWVVVELLWVHGVLPAIFHGFSKLKHPGMLFGSSSRDDDDEFAADAKSPSADDDRNTSDEEAEEFVKMTAGGMLHVPLIAGRDVVLGGEVDDASDDSSSPRVRQTLLGSLNGTNDASFVAPPSVYRGEKLDARTGDVVAPASPRRERSVNFGVPSGEFTADASPRNVKFIDIPDFVTTGIRPPPAGIPAAPPRPLTADEAAKLGIPPPPPPPPSVVPPSGPSGPVQLHRLSPTVRSSLDTIAARRGKMAEAVLNAVIGSMALEGGDPTSLEDVEAAVVQLYEATTPAAFGGQGALPHDSRSDEGGTARSAAALAAKRQAHIGSPKPGDRTLTDGPGLSLSQLTAPAQEIIRRIAAREGYTPEAFLARVVALQPPTERDVLHVEAHVRRVLGTPVTGVETASPHTNPLAAGFGDGAADASRQRGAGAALLLGRTASLPKPSVGCDPHARLLGVFPALPDDDATPRRMPPLELDSVDGVHGSTREALRPVSLHTDDLPLPGTERSHSADLPRPTASVQRSASALPSAVSPHVHYRTAPSDSALPRSAYDADARHKVHVMARYAQQRYYDEQDEQHRQVREASPQSRSASRSMQSSHVSTERRSKHSRRSSSSSSRDSRPVRKPPPSRRGDSDDDDLRHLL